MIFLALLQEFPGGITNGNKWYALYGGMQDWNYVAAGCLEITLELSDNKGPASHTLDELWDDNMEAFLAYALVTSLGGARGLVKAADGEQKGKPLPARIHVEGIDHDLFAKPTFGDYYRCENSHDTVLVSKICFRCVVGDQRA